MNLSRFFSIALIASTIYFPAFAAVPNTNNQSNAMMSISSPSAMKDDMQKMSDMMNQMQTMKIQMMGQKMMMMGVKMKMMGEMMLRSDNKDMKDQATQLIKLGEQVFNMGNKMNPNPMPMGKDMKMCPMCEKMMQKNDF